MLKVLSISPHRWHPSKYLPTWIHSTRGCSIKHATNLVTVNGERSVSSIAEKQGPILLRDYQEECISTVLQHVEAGHQRLGISLATGSGKTVNSLSYSRSSKLTLMEVIFTQLIGRITSKQAAAVRTLILVHRRELVEQAARHCAASYPCKTIEVEMGNTHASGAADITVASIWSLVSKERLSKYDPGHFKLVLVDEAHHIVAPSYMKVLKHFGLLADDSSNRSPLLIGVSATMSRFDGIRLSDAIDRIVYHKDYVDMIEDSWLAEVVFTTVQSNADVSRVKSGPSGDFQTGALSRAVNTEESNLVTVRAWMEKASRRKSTLVFCVDVAHVMSLTALFRGQGIDAHCITGATPKHERGKRLDAFRNNEFPVLLNCGVFTEGTDIPNVDCIILARPTKSRNLLVQMIGRGMRLHEGKKDCHVIDMVASLQTGIITTPTLLGLDPNTLLTESSIKDLMMTKTQEPLKSEAQDDGVDGHQESSMKGSRKLKFTDYGSVFDLIEDTSGETRIRGMSTLAWVMTGPGRWILSSEKGSYLTIEENVKPEGPLFRVVYTTRLTDEDMETFKTKSPYMRPRQIAAADSFPDAVHAADTFAVRRMQYTFVHSGQRWRGLPATEAQLAFLNKLRPRHDPLTADSMTKGKAMDMITKIKFGAKGHFRGVEARKRKDARAENQALKVDMLRRREQVQVGPLVE